MARGRRGAGRRGDRGRGRGRGRRGVRARLGARPGPSLFGRLNADRGPAADRFFRGVTELGSIGAPIGACAALALRGRSRAGVDALGAATAAWFLGQWLKKRHLRDRPYQAADHATRLLIGEPHGTSWPSSHPAVLLAFLTVAARDLDLPAGRRAWAEWAGRRVGLSRAYIGVHYPSDVVGGLLLGRAVAEAWLPPLPSADGAGPPAPARVTSHAAGSRCPCSPMMRHVRRDRLEGPRSLPYRQHVRAVATRDRHRDRVPFGRLRPRARRTETGDPRGRHQRARLLGARSARWWARGSATS